MIESRRGIEVNSKLLKCNIYGTVDTFCFYTNTFFFCKFLKRTSWLEWGSYTCISYFIELPKSDKSQFQQYFALFLTNLTTHCTFSKGSVQVLRQHAGGGLIQNTDTVAAWEGLCAKILTLSTLEGLDLEEFGRRLKIRVKIFEMNKKL